MPFNEDFMGKTVKVSGPLIIAEGMADSKMFDVVRVSDKGLIGEIIELRGDKASIQVYEETSGLGPGEEVVSTGEPLSAELGPGLISGIFDGIQRPLTTLYFKYGARISRGVSVNNLDRDKNGASYRHVKRAKQFRRGIFSAPFRKPSLSSTVYLFPTEWADRFFR